MVKTSLMLLMVLLFAATSLASVQEVTYRDREIDPLTQECADCHAGMMNPERRVLQDMHDDKKLNHGDGRIWCLDCHDPQNTYSLRSPGERKVTWQKSDELCGKCHAKIQEDFELGIHTKWLGGWDKPKISYQCVECHNPHDPEFKKIAPEPAPLRNSGMRQVGHKANGHKDEHKGESNAGH